MMRHGWSASTGSAGHSVDSAATRSCHQRSRPSFQGTSAPLRRCTMTCSTLGEADTASSAVRLSGTGWPRRAKASAVMSRRAPQPSSREATACAP